LAVAFGFATDQNNASLEKPLYKSESCLNEDLNMLITLAVRAWLAIIHGAMQTCHKS